MLGFVSTEPSEIGEQGTLCGLSRNIASTIQSIQGTQTFRDRLKSVGIVEGSRIKVLRTGCPVIVHLEGGRFCLRKEDASRIRVQPVSEKADA